MLLTPNFWMVVYIVTKYLYFEYMLFFLLVKESWKVSQVSNIN